MTQFAFYGDSKLKQKIVQRALEHKELGTIVQKDYGSFEILEPGTAKFKGCAVGCLVQPTQYIKIFDGFTDRHELQKWIEDNDIPVGATQSAEVSDDTYEKLREEFNFSNNLCLIIESIFETMDPSEAQRWPHRVVNAISLSKDISDEAIAQIVNNNRELQYILGLASDTIGSDNFEGDLLHCYDVWMEWDYDHDGEPISYEVGEWVCQQLSR